jgi:hypothetical protein
MTTSSTSQPADISAVQSEHEFFAQSDDPSVTADGRRFPRRDLRACINAVVYAPPGETAGEAADDGTRCQILTRDISRGGMNILHKQQLFPGQKIDVVLADGQQRRLEVTWCRRLGVGCYSAGCRFVKGTS